MESRPRPGSVATLDAEASHSDSNIIGILFAKPEGPIVHANDEFLRMVGHSREDLEAGRLDWLKMTPMEWNFATRDGGQAN